MHYYNRAAKCLQQTERLPEFFLLVVTFAIFVECHPRIRRLSIRDSSIRTANHSISSSMQLPHCPHGPRLTTFFPGGNFPARTGHRISCISFRFNIKRAPGVHQPPHPFITKIEQHRNQVVVVAAKTVIFTPPINFLPTTSIQIAAPTSITICADKPTKTSYWNPLTR